MTLPGGFSPTQALRQVADTINPFDGTNTDYDVFGTRSFGGGARNEAAGSTDSWLGGGQGTVNQGYVLGANDGYNKVAGGGGQAPNNPAPTGNGNGNTNVAVDPYARFGGQTAYKQKVNNYGQSANSKAGAARQSLTDVGNTYDQKNNAFIGDITTGQDELNRGFSGNELNLRRSMQNIVRGLQSGIRSGGVALAGMNASDSGAADALARAYARTGNEQTGDARGQAATQFEDLQRQQGALNSKRTQGEADLGTFRDTETGRVRSDFGDKINALASDAQAGGFGNIVDTNVVDQVLNEALGRLQGIDASRGQRLSGVKQWTPDEIMKEAIRQDELGAAGNAFRVAGPDVSYGGGVPLNGAPLGQLPIYSKGRDDSPMAVKPKHNQA